MGNEEHIKNHRKDNPFCKMENNLDELCCIVQFSESYQL